MTFSVFIFSESEVYEYSWSSVTVVRKDGGYFRRYRSRPDRCYSVVVFVGVEIFSRCRHTCMELSAQLCASL